MEELLPDVLEGRIQPGRVLDRIIHLDGVPDGYRAMNERRNAGRSRYVTCGPSYLSICTQLAF